MSKKGLVLVLALTSILSVAQASDIVKRLCGAGTSKNSVSSDEHVDYEALRDHYFSCPNCFGVFQNWFQEPSPGRSQDAVFCPTVYEVIWGLLAGKHNSD